MRGRDEGDREEEEAAGTAPGSAPTTGLSPTDAPNGRRAGRRAVRQLRGTMSAPSAQAPPVSNRLSPRRAPPRRRNP